MTIYTRFGGEVRQIIRKYENPSFTVQARVYWDDEDAEHIDDFDWRTFRVIGDSQELYDAVDAAPVHVHDRGK